MSMANIPPADARNDGDKKTREEKKTKTMQKVELSILKLIIPVREWNVEKTKNRRTSPVYGVHA